MFEIIEPARPATKPKVKPNEVTVSLRQAPGGRCTLMEMSFGVQVVQRLGWREGKQLTIAWGAEKDQGKVKIAPRENGPAWLLKSGNKKGLVFKLWTSALPEGLVERMPRATAKYEVVSTAAREPAPFLVIDLPREVFDREAAAAE